MKSLNFMIESIRLRISEQMMYKMNFIIMIFTLMSFDLILPLVTILIYMNSSGFPGWNFNEILLFQGIFIIVNAIDRMFFQRVDWSLSYDVRTGMFDRYLLYPIGTLQYISFTNFGLEHVANLILGFVLIIYSIVKLKIILTLTNLLLFFAFVFLAILFIFSIAILNFSIIVRAVRVGRLGEFFRTIKNFGQYPVNIYNLFLSSLFRYVFPLTIMAYIPSKILLGDFPDNLLIVSVVIILFFFICRALWKSALKNYTSAGG